jgi:pimeloyl-ACP methyl ester carboxylesterase
MKEQKFKTEGVTLNYVEGPDTGLPLILLPGQAGTWQSYEKVLLPLSENYRVFAIDIRGHGGSSWTTGEYNFNLIGNDLVSFIDEVVGEPTVISGNSSGGLIALWLAVNLPQMVKGIVLEDAPLFSADWPRIKDEFVYEVLDKTARHLGGEEGPDYRGFFGSIERPKKDGGVKKLPRWIIEVLGWIIDRYEVPGEPLDIPWLPGRMRQLLRLTSTFDPDFSRAWVDGRIYEGLNHEEALRKVRCPMLIIHADWFRSEKGLVGAMDDDDAVRAQELAPHARYFRVRTGHVFHSEAPEDFVRLLDEFIMVVK